MRTTLLLPALLFPLLAEVAAAEAPTPSPMPPATGSEDTPSSPDDTSTPPAETSPPPSAADIPAPAPTFAPETQQPAAATSPLPAPAPIERVESSFVALGRLDGVSRVGVEMTHLSNAQGGGHLFNGALFGRYVDPRSGLGGYATLPFALASGVHADRTALELSGLEVGALYARPLSSGAALIAHAGFAFGPLADDVDYLAYAAVATPADLPNVVEGGKLRAGVSPVLRSGNLIARVDLGATVLLEGRADVGPLITFGAGAGVTADRLHLMVEVAGLTIVSQPDDPLVNAWFTARYHGTRARPYFAFGTPLSEVRALFSFLATVGVDVAF